VVYGEKKYPPPRSPRLKRAPLPPQGAPPPLSTDGYPAFIANFHTILGCGGLKRYIENGIAII